MKSHILIILFAFMFLVEEVSAAPQRLCLNESTGSIRTKRRCRADFGTELSSANLTLGKIVSASFNNDGSIVTASDEITTPAIIPETGLYQITISGVDVSTCTFNVSPLIRADGATLTSGTLNVANRTSGSTMNVFTYDGTPARANIGFTLIGHCPN